MTVAQGTDEIKDLLRISHDFLNGRGFSGQAKIRKQAIKTIEQLEAENAALSAQVVELQNKIRNARVQREAAEAHVEALQKALKSAQCPDPKCSDGSIISTGPEPQNDQCGWCYGRHLLVDEFEDEA